jgi:hypothetical protein
MRLFCLAVILIGVTIATQAQTPVGVRVLVGDSWFKNDNEWETETFSELRDEVGNVLPPSNSYYYEWEYRIEPSQTWIPEGLGTGYGVWWGSFDGHYGETHYIRVRVTIGQTVLQSDGEQTISRGGTPVSVYCFGEREDGSRLPSVVRLQMWSGFHWDRNTVGTLGGQIFLSSGGEHVRTAPIFEPSIIEKFLFWRPVAQDNINHKLFVPSSQSNLLLPKYRSTHNATLKATLIDVGAPGGQLNFKDPWQINYYDPPYGYRNRGFDQAIDTLVGYSQNNLGINTNFKGVFLNQGYPRWDPPLLHRRRAEPAKHHRVHI